MYIDNRKIEILRNVVIILLICWVGTTSLWIISIGTNKQVYIYVAKRQITSLWPYINLHRLQTYLDTSKYSQWRSFKTLKKTSFATSGHSNLVSLWSSGSFPPNYWPNVETEGISVCLTFILKTSKKRTLRQLSSVYVRICQ